MSTLLPDWLMNNYLKLFRELKTDEFVYLEISEILKEKDLRKVGLIISLLKRKGWATVKSQKKDKRKKIYKLRSYRTVIEEIMEGLK